jgi:hypothetical protein
MESASSGFRTQHYSRGTSISPSAICAETASSFAISAYDRSRCPRGFGHQTPRAGP